MAGAPPPLPHHGAGPAPVPRLLDSDLRDLLAVVIFLLLSVDQKLEYFLSHRDWPFIGMFSAGTTVEDNKMVI